ncbi:histone H1.11R-like [Zootoca vivipara]|uniref:histone H1.11R-like n=1 Tax=Zootoca vivipara TaxID=8524 RepID=UPI00293BA0EF|nr:histone H1.11R-like [Zootoca vivipara]
MMELLVQVASTCKECHRVFLAALQKVLVAGSYDVDKNSKNSCFKNLMSQGVLVQSNSTSTLGSFRVSKDQASTLEGKKKAVAQKKPTAVAKSKKAPAKKSREALMIWHNIRCFSRRRSGHRSRRSRTSERASLPHAPTSQLIGGKSSCREAGSLARCASHRRLKPLLPLPCCLLVLHCACVAALPSLLAAVNRGPL